MKNVLITGSNGQLGLAVKIASLQSAMEFKYHFLSHRDLDLSDYQSVDRFISDNEINICINCGAFTKVDIAEKEPERAMEINGLAVKNLAQAISRNNGLLVQISTDFVFDGKSNIPYLETDAVNPLNVYGNTKLQGEKYAMEYNVRSIIIRTSWVYSNDGQNFLNTMMHLGMERDHIEVVYDQIGTPTFTQDLAGLLISIIDNTELEGKYGIYHYSNEGVASWYDFASAIMEYTELGCQVFPITSNSYPTPARRPSYSILNKNKIKSTFGIAIPHWRQSLKSCLGKRKYQS